MILECMAVSNIVITIWSSTRIQVKCHTKFRAFGNEYDTSTAYDEATKSTVYIHSAVCPVCKIRCYNAMVLV